MFLQFQGADTQPTLEKHLSMYLLLTLKDSRTTFFSACLKISRCLNTAF